MKKNFYNAHYRQTIVKRSIFYYFFLFSINQTRLFKKNKQAMGDFKDMQLNQFLYHGDSSDDESEEDTKRIKKETLKISKIPQLQEKYLEKVTSNEDISVHYRKSVWVAFYEKKRLDNCILCTFNEVGFENVGFDMAHVVSRSCGGSNTEAWNRVPVCKTCNQNVKSSVNLLDFTATYYPSRLVFIVKKLYQRFSLDQVYLYTRFFHQKGLELFVRTIFGTGGYNFYDKEKTHKLFKTLSPDFLLSESERSGRVKNENVYRILRDYDHIVVQKQNLYSNLISQEKDIESMERIMFQLRERICADKKKLQIICDRIDICESGK